MLINTLKKAVESIHGVTFAGLDTKTTVTLKGGKKNPLQGRVVKRTSGSNVMIYSGKSGYEDMVKRRLLTEGKDPHSFELGPRAWGERIEGTPFIEHKDKNYLEVIFVSPGKSEYLVDGKVTNPADIEGLELKKDKEEKDPEADTSQGGLDNKVIIRTYDVASISEIRIGGEVYS